MHYNKIYFVLGLFTGKYTFMKRIHKERQTVHTILSIRKDKRNQLRQEMAHLSRGPSETIKATFRSRQRSDKQAKQS